MKKLPIFLILFCCVSLTLALEDLLDNRLQQELDMGAPSNLEETAVAAAMEGGSNSDDFAIDFETSEKELYDDPPPPLALPVAPLLTASQLTNAEETSSVWPTSATTRVQRLWGIPDTSAIIGKLFTFSVPKDAFSGDISSYEITGLQGESLPLWLKFKSSSLEFEGVPSDLDAGELYVKVVAKGSESDTARDVFAINIVKSSPFEIQQTSCEILKERMLITILVDAKMNEISPYQKASSIKNLAGFLGIPIESVEIDTQNTETGVSLNDESVIAAGAGNVQRPRSPLEPAVVFRFLSNCAKPTTQILTERLGALARDGTLSEVIQLPVVGWIAQTTPKPVAQSNIKPLSRQKRQVSVGSGGSGDSEDGEEDYEYEEEDDDADEESGITPDAREIPTMASPTFPEPTATTPRLNTIDYLHNHHRHGHGDKQDIGRGPAASAAYDQILKTPTLTPIKPTRVFTSDMFSSIQPSRVAYDYSTPSVTPGIPSSEEEEYEDSEEEVQPSSSERAPTSPYVTQPLPPSSSSTPRPPPETTTGALEPPSSSTEESSSTSRTQTEQIEFGIKNFEPKINKRLIKLPVIAGKAFKYQIPEDTFQDFEDGSTRNLRLIFKSTTGSALSQSSWIQFDPIRQEVYGLPLEEHVSKWSFGVEAMDKDGKTGTDTLEVIVQQHKGARTVNHEFTLQLRIEQKFDFPSAVDWQIQVMNNISQFFGDADASQITVINATSSMNAVDKVFFTWTNDSLPRNQCPKAEIQKMYDSMTLNERGEASLNLKEALGHAFKIKHVTFKGTGQCELFALPKSKEGPPTQIPDLSSAGQNFAPTLRNPVDHLNVSVGQLLVFRVPEDTFYDPEDGSTRNMKLTLLTMNRSPVDTDHWLQFDVKNQEFYGIPSESDKGSKEYQLVCEDSGGLAVNDGLVVVVQPTHHLPYNVEFRMTLANPPLDEFHNSAATKRRLLERLGALFGDSDARNIVLAGLRIPPYQHVVGPAPAVEVSWYNKSLPVENCPEQEVAALRKMLVDEESPVSGNAILPSTSLGGRVADIMKSEFPVLRVSMVPQGLCQGEFAFEHTPPPPEPPSDEDLATFSNTSSSDEYLTTYIVPAVVIAAMLLLAGLIACALYRRNRRGKLSVGETGNGAGFRSRGIPVIFQDELDEKAIESVAKSPVIMKNEKPPLPPPEYPQHIPGSTPHATPPMHHPHHRQPTAEDPLLGSYLPEDSEASPYQPPPPFTSNRDTGRQGRPKPTPTYRKPPPYVPP